MEVPTTPIAADGILELHPDGYGFLADRRIWPAIDVERSGTRREEKLLDPATLAATTSLRRSLNQMQPHEAMEQLTAQLAKYDSNQQFLTTIRNRIAAGR